MALCDTMQTENFFSAVPADQLKTILDLLDTAIVEETAERSPEQIKEIVPVEQWLNYKYFLGPWSRDLYQYWKQRVPEYINSGVPELVVTGSIGTGKTSFALICMIRKIYELSCYRYPQRLFTLSDLTDLYFAYLSINYSHAQKTGFGQLRSMMDAIPYFQKEFPRDMNIDSVLKFPNKIHIIPGTDNLSVISTNLFGAIMDEADFYRKGTGGQMGDAQRAAAIYQEITDRRMTRFMVQGYDPGFSAVVSSTSYDSSFVQQRKRAGERAGTPVYTARLWDVKPTNYSRETFAVFKGTDKLDAIIIDSIDDLKSVAPPGMHNAINQHTFTSDYDGYALTREVIKCLPSKFQSGFVYVPKDFRKNFEGDIYTALRNIAGASVAPTGKLFTSKVVWLQNIDKELKHPFTKTDFIISVRGPDRVQNYFKPDVLFEVERDDNGKLKKIGKLKRHSNALRFVHIDQSLAKDKTGISMCHVAGFVEDPDTLMRIPIIEFDFLLRIIAPKPPDKISIAKVRNFIFYLKSLGVNFGKVSYDQFQSADSIQIMTTHGIPSENLSVDRTDKEYIQFVDLLFERRTRMYQHDIFEKEMFNLDHDLEKGKVDHPDKLENGEPGSKDVADSAVGAVANCLSDPSKQETRSSEDIVEDIGTPGRTGKKNVEPLEKDWVAKGTKYTLPHNYKGKGVVTGFVEGSKEHTF